MKDFVLTEIVDIRRLEKAIRSKHYPSNDPHSQIHSGLIKYRLSFNGNKKETVYRKSKKSGGYGRLYVPGNGFELLRGKKEIRNYIINDKMIDIDQVNSHPSIILSEFKKKGLPTVFIQEYCENREEYLKNNPGTTKDMICSMLYDNDPCYIREYPDIVAFHNILYNQYLNFIKDDKVFMKSLGRNTIDDKSILSVYIHELEYTFIKKVIGFMNSKEITVGAYMYDGIMVYPDERINQDLLDECCVSIGYPQYKLVVKPTTTSWRPDIEQEVVVEEYSSERVSYLMERAFYYDEREELFKYKKEKWQEMHKGYLSKFLCFIKCHDGSVMFNKRVGDEPVIVKPGNLDNYLGVLWANTCFKYPTRSIGTLWLKYNDRFLTEYDSYDYIVNKNYLKLPKYKNVLNMYREPEYLVDESWDIHTEMPLLSEYIYKIITNDKVNGDFILTWMSAVLFLGRTGVAIILNGTTGIGKTYFVNTLMRGILSDGSTAIVKDVEEELFGNFNEHTRKYQVVMVDEITSKKAQSWQVTNKFKNLITAEHILYHKKNFSMTEGINNVNIVMGSNDLIPRVLEDNNRRYIGYDVSSHRKDDVEYFRALAKEIDDNVLKLRGYLYTICPVDNHEVQSRMLKIPRSEYIQNIIDMSMKAEVRFGIQELHYHINSAIDQGNNGLCNEDVRRLYIQYIQTTGYQTVPLKTALLVEALRRIGYKVIRGITPNDKKRGLGIQDTHKFDTTYDPILPLIGNAIATAKDAL